MGKDVNIKVKVDGTDEAKRQLGEVAESTEKVGQTTEGLGGKSKSTGLHLDFLGRGLKSLSTYLTGFVTVTAIFKFFQTWTEWINKTAQAQKDLADSSKGLLDATKDYAGVAGVLGEPGGYDAAKGKIKAVQAASMLPYEDSAKLLSLAQEEYGKPGQLPSQSQVDMVSVVGDFMNRRNLDVATGGKLLKILHAAGVQNPREAALRLQQISDVQAESQIDSLSEFIKGASEVADPLARQGRSFENILASYGFEAEADAIEKENKSIGRDGPKAKVKYRNQMSGRKAYLEQIAQSSDPDRFMRQSMDYRKTLPGSVDSGAAETEAVGSSASDELMLGREAMKTADERFKKLSEEGKSNPYISDEYEKRILIWRDLYQRAKDQGNQGAMDYLQTRRPIPMLGTPSIEDVGKVEKMLQNGGRPSSFEERAKTWNQLYELDRPQGDEGEPIPQPDRMPDPRRGGGPLTTEEVLKLQRDRLQQLIYNDHSTNYFPIVGREQFRRGARVDPSDI